MTKTCTKCKEVKPMIAYCKSKGGKYGVGSVCKACKSLIDKQYREKNKEKLLKQKREYAKAHKDEKKAYDKIYNLKNKEKNQHKEKHGEKKTKKKEIVKSGNVEKMI